MRWKPRQGLRRRVCHGASPGGNGAGVAHQLLRQQRHEELAVEPGAGAVVLALGQVAELRQRLEALEDELDLPADAVPVEHPAGVEVRLGEGGEQDHVAGELER